MVSWLMVAIAAVMIGLSIFTDKSVLIKPSFVASAFFFIQVQVGAAIVAERAFDMLQDPWEFFYLIHGYSILALSMSLIFFRRGYRNSFNRLVNGQILKREINFRANYLIIPAVLIVAWYLSVVPFTSSGLYILITQPELSDEARQSSFVTLASPLLQYAYYLMSIALAPMAAIMMYLLLTLKQEQVSILQRMFAIFLILVFVVMVSLYGARGPSAMLVLALVYVAYLRRGAPFRPFLIISMIMLVMAGPAVLSVFKNADVISLAAYGDALQNIFDRMFVRGVPPNIWYIDFIQAYGEWGVSGIPKLATLVGADPVNVANVISLRYVPNSLKDGTANSAYITQYYSFFGGIGVIVSLLGLLVLDFIIYIYRYLRPVLLLPVVGAMVIPLASLSFSQFTTILFTKGMVFILAGGLFMQWLPMVNWSPLPKAVKR